MTKHPKVRLSPQDLEEWRLSIGAPFKKDLAKWLGITPRAYDYWLARHNPIPRWMEIIVEQQNQILDLQTMLDQLMPKGGPDNPET